MNSVCNFLTLQNFCADVADFFTSPLWFWGLVWFGIVFSSWVIGWFFAPLRTVCGIIFLCSTFVFVAFWYGLKLGKERERARHVPVRHLDQPQQQQWSLPDFSWLWPKGSNP